MKPPRELPAVVKLADMTATALHLDRMFGLQIYPRRDNLVAVKVLAMAIAAHACLRRRKSSDAHTDQRRSGQSFEQLASPSDEMSLWADVGRRGLQLVAGA